MTTGLLDRTGRPFKRGRSDRHADHRPNLKVFPRFVHSRGKQVSRIANLAGQPLDCWQSDVMNVFCGVGHDGLWSALECCLLVGRQNGKGTILEARAVAGALGFGERLIMWSAHEMKTSIEAFLRLEAFLNGHPHLSKQVRRIDRGRGSECIYFRNGNRIRIIARSRGSGRGFTGDLVILDEAYALTPEHISALMPTMSARPNPQIIYTSTPPLDTYSGEVMFDLRERAEAHPEAYSLEPGAGAYDGGEDALAYIDYGAVPLNADGTRIMNGETPFRPTLDDIGQVSPETGRVVIDLNDRTLWRQANPAMSTGRITERFLANERRSMDERDFAREVLCIWPPKPAPVKNPVTPNDWLRLKDEDSSLDMTKGIVVSIDITPRRDHASLAVYGLRGDGLGHVELQEHRPGTEWIVDRLLDIKKRRSPLLFIIDGAGPSGAHVEEIEKGELKVEENGIERVIRIQQPTNKHEPKRGDLIVMNAGDMGSACGRLETGVRARNFVHLGETRVDIALAGAAIRNIGDGGWGWARRQSSVDISPLVAFTEAKWGYETFAHLVSIEYDPLQNIW